MPTHAGVKTFQDDDSASYRWVVFSRQEAEQFLNDWGQPLAESAGALSGWRSYSGPGRGFSDEPNIKISRTRVLVTQRCGLDI